MPQFGYSQFNPIRHTGVTNSLAPLRGFPRRPTTSDRNYPIGQYVVLQKDPATGSEGELWYLAYFDSSGDAIWVRIGDTSPGGTVFTLSDTANTEVGPSGTGNIQLVGGTGITVTSDPGTYKLTFALAGGGVAVDQFAVQAATAPGTTSVDPNPGTGLVTVSGAIVANHSVPLETRSRALYAYNVEAQYAAAAAATDGTKSGMAHFDSAKFTVDASGFVSTAGDGIMTSLGVDASTGPGTDPVIPTGGVITVTGAQVATGTVGANVIRTNSTAANEMKVEIQRTTTAASQNSALNGVCHFDSADFTVDSNGFVSAVGTANMTWQTIDANQTLVINNGYICISPGGALSLALPATATIGDTIEVMLDGATSFAITQSAGQQIRLGNMETTLGAGGSLTSNAQGDTLIMVARSSTRWIATADSGNFTVV